MALADLIHMLAAAKHKPRLFDEALEPPRYKDGDAIPLLKKSGLTRKQSRQVIKASDGSTWRLVPLAGIVQQTVGKLAMSAIDYPPMQDPAIPNNIALVLTLTPPPVKEACFTVPREMRNDSARHFFFYLPCLKFDLAAGPNIRDVKSICFHSSDRKVVSVEELSKEIKTVFSVGLKNSGRTQKFHEYIAILNSRRR